MDEYTYVITYGTSLGSTKTIRVTGANPDLTLDELDPPLTDIMDTSVFDRKKVGVLTSLKSVVREKVTKTSYDLKFA